MLDIAFPAKLQPLFERSSYKDIRGGRGSGKSWGVARALLAIGATRPIRVLCTRETQKAMRDSVHRLLVDQIASMGLAGQYQVQQIQITGNKEYIVDGHPVRTEFVFAGLSDLTAESIKSFEGADIVWVEEAQVVSARSWTILIPTIRKPGAEIWLTWNPELDNDPTWTRFVESPPPRTIHIEVNWRDNPWFNESMHEKRLHDYATLKRYEYEWIWEGKCKPAVSGAIYADELVEMYAEGRVGDYPVDATKPVYAVFDLGWNDATAIGICQRIVSQLRIIDYIEDNHKTPDHYSALLRSKPYKVTQLFLPHDGEHADYRTGQSGRMIYQNLGWDVSVLPNSPVEDGIRATRTALKSTFIDAKCTRLLDCLKRYRRVIPVTTGEPSNPKHDQYSHGADMLRYMALAAPDMVDRSGGLKLPPLKYGWAFNGRH